MACASVVKHSPNPFHDAEVARTGDRERERQLWERLLQHLKSVSPYGTATSLAQVRVCRGERCVRSQNVVP